jgi:hypothetical protein
MGAKGPHVQRHAHEDHSVPISLDGCGARQDRINEPVRSNSSTGYSLVSSSSVSASLGALTGQSGIQEPQQKPSPSSSDSSKITSYRPFQTHHEEVVEVPNTPTQRSSQLNMPEPIPILRCDTDMEATSPNDNSMLFDPNPPVKTACTTTLCSVCQTQRVLAKKDNTEVLWYVAQPVTVINI